MRSFLAPGAIAVIGSSWRAHTIGAEIVRNVIAAGFTGNLYPVGSHGQTVHGRRIYESILELPEPLELAVITVQAAEATSAARPCGLAGVRALPVISPGFAEAGARSAGRQHELLEIPPPAPTGTRRPRTGNVQIFELPEYIGAPLVGGI